MDWNLYLAVAKQLHIQGTEEAMRSCISRAYYALYNQAQRKANVTGHEGSESSHKVVWEALLKQGREAKKASQIGSMLHKQRKWADYRIQYPESLDLHSQIAPQQAEEAIAYLNSM